MKMKKMIGAVALTAALAMGTAPAFAASVSSDTENFVGGNAGTDIKATAVDAATASIKATVPIQVGITFGVDGASEITGPTGNAYKITNNGPAVKLTNATLSSDNTDFTFAPFYEDSSDYLDADDNSIVDATNGDNYIMMTIKTGDVYTYLADGHDLKDALAKTGSGKNVTWNDNQFNDEFTDFADIKIADGTSSAKALPIELGGNCYFNKALPAPGAIDGTLCTIKYTLALDE